MDIDKTLNDFSKNWSVYIPKGETGGILDTTKENYDKRIEWHDKEIPKPTWKELEARWEEIKNDPEKPWNQDIIYHRKYTREELENKIDELESRIAALEK
jgi:hypothetical protein